MTLVRTGTEAALMGSFNAAPKCSTATTTLVSVALIGAAGDPVGGVSAQIQVSTPTSIAGHSSQAWGAGGEQAGATNLTTSVIAGLVPSNYACS